ncbi:MAG: selenium-dependent molybdenum cofactor biosynthesis protein YqeB [Spirochaetota bacterium]
MDLFLKAAELTGCNTPFALATIVSSSGSTPRGKAKMIVLANGTTFGTVGGGLVEARIIEESRKAIDFDRSVILDYFLDHGPGPESLDMECGGAMKVLVEVFGAKPRVLIAGGGHVGLEIAKLARNIGYRVAVVDDRPDFVTPERFPMAAELYVQPDMDAALAAAPMDGNTCVVIATHAGDERTLRRFVGSDFRYLGFLGSRRKVRVLMDKLKAEGFPREQLDRIRAPIGLDLGAETPEEIAVSIIAEIMAAVAGRDAAPLSGRNGELVVVRGGGDLGTGVVVRLKAAGFRVVILEIGKPMAIRRTVCLAEAVYEGQSTVEGVHARLATDLDEAMALLAVGSVPVLVDPDCSFLQALSPFALVDAVMAKRNTGIRRGMAPAVIALGPGVEAGGDVDAVIETNRGHFLGRVIMQGSAMANTGVPGNIAGRSAERVIKAPISGTVEAIATIGQVLKAGSPVLAIAGDGDRVPVTAAIDGVLRGMIRPGLVVTAGEKIADIDPRCEPEHCQTVSDKARAVAGGVLEALLLLKGRVKR